MTPDDRRRHARFRLATAYTPVSVRPPGSDAFDVEGHAYDLSESGVRFDIDRLLEPGTPVAMQITLPCTDDADLGPGRAVLVFANLVWVADREDPGPWRAAAVFTEFARAGDRERLVKHIASGRYRTAA